MKHELELRQISIGNSVIKLFVPKEESVRRLYRKEKEEHTGTPFPYWAQVWPSALALSRFLQEHPQYVAGKDILELAAGLGLPSLLAARFANSVCCSDYLAEPLEVVMESIAANGATNISIRQLDWHHLPKDLRADVLLLSDINYDPKEFEILFKVLSSFLQKGTLILLSTPQRLMAKPFIERLLPWCMQQNEAAIPINEEITLITVMVLRNNR